MPNSLSSSTDHNYLHPRLLPPFPPFLLSVPPSLPGRTPPATPQRQAECAAKLLVLLRQTEARGLEKKKRSGEKTRTRRRRRKRRRPRRRSWKGRGGRMQVVGVGGGGGGGGEEARKGEDERWRPRGRPREGGGGMLLLLLLRPLLFSLPPWPLCVPVYGVRWIKGVISCNTSVLFAAKLPPLPLLFSSCPCPAMPAHPSTHKTHEHTRV